MNGSIHIAGVETMITAKRQTVSTAAVPSNSGSGILLIGSTLLIMVGLVFQAGLLGVGQLRFDNLWLVSVVASDLWNLAASHIGGPTVAEVLRYWPLILVGLGLSIMLATQENRLSRTRKGAKHGL
jgi:hypothetical protein